MNFVFIKSFIASKNKANIKNPAKNDATKLNNTKSVLTRKTFNAALPDYTRVRLQTRMRTF
jgi:hypothetical protein